MSIDRCGTLVRALLLTFSLVALLWLLFNPERLDLLRLVLLFDVFIMVAELVFVAPNGPLSLGIDVLI